MLFDLTQCPSEVASDHQPQVGDVFKAAGGKVTTAFWVVVTVGELYSYSLGINKAGEVVSAQRYRASYWKEREFVGRAKLPKPIEIEWLE